MTITIHRADKRECYHVEPDDLVDLVHSDIGGLFGRGNPNDYPLADFSEMREGIALSARRARFRAATPAAVQGRRARRRTQFRLDVVAARSGHLVVDENGQIGAISVIDFSAARLPLRAGIRLSRIADHMNDGKYPGEFLLRDRPTIADLAAVMAAAGRRGRWVVSPWMRHWKDMPTYEAGTLPGRYRSIVWVPE